MNGVQPVTAVAVTRAEGLGGKIMFTSCSLRDAADCGSTTPVSGERRRAA
jgi:hypothetical protein